MLLIAVIALLTWIGAGTALLWWQSRPRGSTFTRAIDRRSVPVGGTVRVSLRLIPPAVPAAVPEPHDVVLLLDQSSSMGDGPGSALASAIRAAENFVRRCPASDGIGLVAFNGTASVLSPITKDHAAVLRALQSIAGGDGTSIHAALAEAVGLFAAIPGDDDRRTAILLSDGASDSSLALAEAARLREHARIVTIGFSDSADAELLTGIAGPTGRFFHVADAGDLADLFAALAAFVSADAAIAGTVEEPASAPEPFQLADTGLFHPLRVEGDAHVTIAWSVPVMDLRAVALSYDLVPECPGWHSVARSGGRARWQLSSGAEEVSSAPPGPRVLVLPSWLVWSWPILNPLFWILFGRLFCRRRAVARVENAHEEPEPLVLPTLPAPLEPPHPALYEARLRPALIIGVGEAGEWAVTHLGHRLADRGHGRDTATLLAVRAMFEESREPTRVGAFELGEDEKIDLRQDLRPYLESLRKGAPPVRRWIPFVDWLGRIGPRTTAWIRDRREARLALLQRPRELEARIGAAIAAMKTRSLDETALVIGSAADPECSGMLAEVAHLLAGAGAQTTAIVARSRVSDGRHTEELEALAHELERMLLMRGDEVLSDRSDPPASARQLLDRLVVLREDVVSSRESGQGIADLVWQFLAYPEVLRRMPMARADAAGQFIECCTVEQTSMALPVESLWRWTRARALARAINGVWLGLEEIQGVRQLPPPARDVVEKWVNAFWAPSGFSRPQSLLVRAGAGLIGDTASESSMHAFRGRLPATELYAEQAAFADLERQTTAQFLEVWCQALLDDAYRLHQSGLVTLFAALRGVEDGVAAVQRRMEETAVDPRSAAAGRLGLSLYGDLASFLEGFRKRVERWIAVLAGTQLPMGVLALEREPLSVRIDRIRAQAELDVLFPTQAVREEAERREEAWYQQYGAALLDQLRFRFIRDGRQPRLSLELAGKTVTDDALAALEAFLAPYRADVLSWTIGDALDPAAIDQPARRFRAGALAARVHPDVMDVAEDADPYVAAATRVDRSRLSEAMGVRQGGVRRLPYAWPEEANSVRVSALITNSIARRAHAFSPAAVHLLRDTNALHDFLADLADGRVSIRNGRCWLSRQGNEYWIGDSSTTTSALESLVNFEKMARQAALLKRSLDAAAIPPREERWSISPDDAVDSVERNPLVQSSVAAEKWPMWQDVIRGVVIDVDSQHRVGSI